MRNSQEELIMDKYVNLDCELLNNFVTEVFIEYGIPTEDAKICADVLIEADRRGIESHGINRLKPIYLDRLKAGVQLPVTDLEVVKETKTTGVLDGHNGMGQVIGYRAMEMAIKKAKECGMGMVAVRNSTHYGIAGYYTSMAAKEGCIGITGTNARPSVAPTFGTEGMLGTNPLTIGFPTDEDFPFNLDCATSIIQRGRVEYYAREGRDCPKGTVITEDYSDVTDAREILQKLSEGTAAFAPLGGAGEDLGGYKGYGYSVAVEVLSAALQSGSYLKALNDRDEQGNRRPCNLGHFFIAIDTEAFLGLEAFKETAGNILRQLRNSEKAPEHDKIYTAGEKEYMTWLLRKDTGIPVSPSLQKELKSIRDELSLTGYEF